MIKFLEKDITRKLVSNTDEFHRILCKIRDFFNPSVKFLEQDEILKSIVQSMLEASDTEIYTPLQGPWYLKNDRMHYTVRLGQGSVTVVNSVHTVARDVPVGVTDFLRDLVDTAVDTKVEKLDDSIIQKEKGILEAILNEKDTHKITTRSNTVFHE